jgi:putative transposase
MLTFVLVRKAYRYRRYRAYPNPHQIARMLRWEPALRWLWNLALEQRLYGMRLVRGERVYPTAFDQINELKELCEVAPWLADVPRNVCAELLRKLQFAWERCFDRKARAPRWKRRGRDVMSLTEPHPRQFRIDGSTLRFPKLGNIPIVLHRPLVGKPKTCTLKRDRCGDWFVTIICEIEVVVRARTEPVVGIDRGVANLVADSKGNVVPNPFFAEKMAPRMRRAQRNLSRKKKGSKNREKANRHVAVLYRKVTRQRDHVLHNLSAHYAKSHGTVVLEDLQIENMTRSAKGTVDAPGVKVKQKSGLNSAIRGACWGRLAKFTGYKLAWSGGTLEKVPAAHSSQTCAACGHVDPLSRKGERFCCTVCGHRDHADVNAAKVLVQRYEKTRVNRPCQPVEASRSKAGRRSRKVGCAVYGDLRASYGEADLPRLRRLFLLTIVRFVDRVVDDMRREAEGLLFVDVEAGEAGSDIAEDVRDLDLDRVPLHVWEVLAGDLRGEVDDAVVADGRGGDERLPQVEVVLLLRLLGGFHSGVELCRVQRLRLLGLAALPTFRRHHRLLRTRSQPDHPRSCTADGRGSNSRATARSPRRQPFAPRPRSRTARPVP